MSETNSEDRLRIDFNEPVKTLWLMKPGVPLPAELTPDDIVVHDDYGWVQVAAKLESKGGTGDAEQR